jgi:hypothetical protein
MNTHDLPPLAVQSPPHGSIEQFPVRGRHLQAGGVVSDRKHLPADLLMGSARELVEDFAAAVSDRPDGHHTLAAK